MDEPESFEDLLRPDEMALRFTPLGLSTGGLVMSPEGKLRHLKEEIASAELVPDVPDEVRQHFARLRKLYLYGLLEYDLFTLVEDLVHLMLEAAFRVRFITHYDGKIPITRKGASEVLEVESFDDLRKTARGCKLVCSGRTEDIPMSLSALSGWARRERLLVGQRSRMLEEGMADSRNHAAHPVNYSVTMPVEVGRTLSNVAEIINKLWGADTPGGRLFPGPIPRVPQAIAVASDGRAAKHFPSLLSVGEDDPKFRDWIYTVYLAALDEDLVRVGGGGPKPIHRPGFETTMLPCELLWGPGPRDELVPRLGRFEDEAHSDHVEYLDRVFVIRVDGDRPDDARSPEQFHASPETTGVWYVIRSDHPPVAWCHVRDHRDKPASDLKDGCCPDCAVTELGRFKSRTATAANLKPLTRSLGTGGGAS